MSLTISGFLRDFIGKAIYIPGYATAECVAVFWKFNQLHKGETYSANGAFNLWEQNGKPYVWNTYARVTGALRYGDWTIWHGSYGAYMNGGYGHVAMYLEDAEPGFAWFASQNPGPFQRVKLSLFGAVGQLRAIGVLAGDETALVNRALSGNAFVRTGPGIIHPLAPGYGEPIAKGETVSAMGYVSTSDPVFTNWVKTRSGFFIHESNISGGIKGLTQL